MAALDFFGSRLFRLRRELAELRSRLATTRELARVRSWEAQAARQRAAALVEDSRRLLEAARKQR